MLTVSGEWLRSGGWLRSGEWLRSGCHSSTDPVEQDRGAGCGAAAVPGTAPTPRTSNTAQQKVNRAGFADCGLLMQ